jgi:hypothetical protein
VTKDRRLTVTVTYRDGDGIMIAQRGSTERDQGSRTCLERLRKALLYVLDPTERLFCIR